MCCDYLTVANTSIFLSRLLALNVKAFFKSKIFSYFCFKRVFPRLSEILSFFTALQHTHNQGIIIVNRYKSFFNTCRYAYLITSRSSYTHCKHTYVHRHKENILKTYFLLSNTYVQIEVKIHFCMRAYAGT